MEEPPIIRVVRSTREEARRLVSRGRTRRKRRSRWKHPHDPNRNRRRLEKRRRSASSRARVAREAVRAAEASWELEEVLRAAPTLTPRRPHGRPERRPSRGLEPRRAW